MASVLRLRHSADAPTERISSTSVSVSRLRGTLSSVTRFSVNNAAAMIGSAAFLLPAGSIVPLSLCPPSTTYWIGGTGAPWFSDVDVGAERIFLDEFAARLDHVAHQLGEDGVGLVDFLDLDLQQGALIGVQRGLPQLARVHLAEAFIALQLDALAAGAGHGLEQVNRPVDHGFGVLAAQQA